MRWYCVASFGMVDALLPEEMVYGYWERASGLLCLACGDGSENDCQLRLYNVDPVHDRLRHGSLRGNLMEKE